MFWRGSEVSILVVIFVYFVAKKLYWNIFTVL